jgi:hypothetical protein
MKCLLKEFIKYFLGSEGLDASWHWYRFEWQKRGNIHVHGLARLSSDPGLSKYGENVILGRKAQKVLELYIKIKKEMHLELPSILTDLQFKDVPPEDEHLPYTINQLKIKFNDENYVMSETDIQTFIGTMDKGHRSEQCICVYRDYLLSSMNPDCPVALTVRTQYVHRTLRLFSYSSDSGVPAHWSSCSERIAPRNVAHLC